MGSATKTEVVKLYMHALDVSPMRITLQELNHPQPANPMQIDNSIVKGIINTQSNIDKAKQWVHFLWTTK